MKTDAIYHLMMVRLLQLTDGLPEAETDFADALRDTLKIEFEEGAFVFHWQWQHKNHIYRLSAKNFKFYGRGDDVKADRPTGTRRQNWDEAEVALRAMAVISNATLPADRFKGAMGLSSRVVTEPDEAAWPLVLPALAAGLIAAFRDNSLTGVKSAILALLLCLMLRFQKRTLLAQPVGLIAYSAAAAGALIVILSNMSFYPACLLAAGYALLGYAEEQGASGRPSLWIMTGLLLGAPVFCFGIPALLPLILMLGALSLVAWVAPVRLSFAAVKWGLGAALITGVIGCCVTAYRPAPLSLSSTWLALSWVTSLGALASGLLWWILGRQYILTPMLTLLSLGVYGLIVNADAQFMDNRLAIAAFAGFVMISLVRLIATVWMTRLKSSVHKDSLDGHIETAVS